MEMRSLEIKVTSAKGLKKVKRLMDVFVAVKLSGDPKSSNHREQRTQVAKDSGTTPKWSDNNVLKFSIDQTLAEANRLVITFKIRCDQGGEDKEIGEVHVPVKELLDHLGNDKTGQRYVTYKLKPNGDISFTYSFSDGPVVVTDGGSCSRYPVPEPVVRPATTQTHRPVLNGPVLSELLPNGGSFNYGHIPSQPPIYPPANIFPGLYMPPHPHGYIPESPSTMYSTVAQSIFPGLSFPSEVYPPPYTPPPGLYPPMNPYRF